MTQSLTTRSPGGATNAAAWQTMAQSGCEDPTWMHQDFDDFDTFAAGDYTATAVGTSAITQTPFDGGAILLSTSAGIADALYVQRIVASHKLTAGKDAFFKFRGQLSDVTASVFHCGLIATSATPLAAADGVYIVKATAQAALSLVSKVGGVSTTVAFPATALLVAATPFELGIHVDAQGNVEAFFNPTTGNNPISASAAAAGQSRGYVARLAAPGVTQALLNPSFGLLNSAAAIKTLTADFFVAGVSR
jgi:hypothetical protein